jgi:hypothetical protein
MPTQMVTKKLTTQTLQFEIKKEKVNELQMA